MSDLRFDVGAAVMCNLGPNGWKLGRVIALRYREAQWPAQKTAPYQVALEDDHTLIYVPEDDDRCCRGARMHWRRGAAWRCGRPRRTMPLLRPLSPKLVGGRTLQRALPLRRT